MTTVLARGVGGGGGGAGSGGARNEREANVGDNAGGGGGGAGAPFDSRLVPVQPDVPIAIVVGGGGEPGTGGRGGGDDQPGTDGRAGGDSRFGDTLVFPGGNGGQGGGGALALGARGGAGGAGSTSGVATANVGAGGSPDRNGMPGQPSSRAPGGDPGTVNVNCDNGSDGGGGGGGGAALAPGGSGVVEERAAPLQRVPRPTISPDFRQMAGPGNAEVAVAAPAHPAKQTSKAEPEAEAATVKYSSSGTP